MFGELRGAVEHLKVPPRVSQCSGATQGMRTSSWNTFTTRLRHSDDANRLHTRNMEKTADFSIFLLKIDGSMVGFA